MKDLARGAAIANLADRQGDERLCSIDSESGRAGLGCGWEGGGAGNASTHGCAGAGRKGD